MFETICFQHWRHWFQRPRDSFEFYMYACTMDDCNWCRLHKALHNYKPNKRFVTNIERHIELKIVKLEELGRPPKRFVISNITVLAIPE